MGIFGVFPIFIWENFKNATQNFQNFKNAIVQIKISKMPLPRHDATPAS
jgi:hypothetical protein